MKKVFYACFLLSSSMSWAFLEEGQMEAVLAEECILVETAEGLRPKCKEIKNGEINTVEISKVPRQTPFLSENEEVAGEEIMVAMFGYNSAGDRTYSIGAKELNASFQTRNKKLSLNNYIYGDNTYKFSKKGNGFQTILGTILEVSAGGKNASISVHAGICAGYSFKSIKQPIYDYLDASATAGAKVKVWKIQGQIDNTVSVQGYNSVRIGFGFNVGKPTKD